MIEFLWGIAAFIVRAISLVLDVWVFFSRMHRLARWSTGSDAIIEVPAEPKAVPPAAQRALDEAEQQRKANYAADGTVHAS
jgi:hypothetical protein